MLIAPKEKNSAEERLYNVGNSITKSTPFDRAISAFVHLSKIEGNPLCTNYHSLYKLKHHSLLILLFFYVI